MSALALEIDQTLSQMDSVTASRLERLIRDALALVQSASSSKSIGQRTHLRFPLSEGARGISADDVASLEDEA